MIGRFLARVWYPLALAVVGLTIVVSGAFAAFVALPGLSSSPTPSSRPSASPSTAAGFMSWVAMPADADCAACHVTDAGAIGLRSVPQLGHPLSGWEQCTACHAPARLVETAPGHSGIHATACLTCHQPATLPAPLSRPHRESQNQACLTCHGVTAPLPEDMAHRPQTVCWLCHRLPEEQPPVPMHKVAPDQTDCLACHVAGKVGALPEDHAARPVSECLLCHAVPADASPLSFLFPLFVT